MNFRVLFLMFLVGLVLPFSARAQNWDQIIKAVASDRAAYDYFGSSVAISGDYAVVGAYFEDEDAAGGAPLSDAGSAYIFKYNGTTWVQEAKLVASDRAAGDYFGYSVAISGDYVVVGAYAEDHNAAGGAPLSEAGSAYIFKRSGTTWSQEAKIVASDRAASDYFGFSVGISGDYVVVGAYAEDEDVAGGATATDAGSAYIFKRNGTSWLQEAKIVASDRAIEDRFGYSLGISGDYVVVGAYAEDHDAAGGTPASAAGSAYIFKRSGTSWSQEAKIVASDRAASDFFGWSVAISGDYVVVGAYLEAHNAAGGSPLSFAGSAYIFKRSGTVWSQEAKIVASDRATNDRFGYSVGISGDYVVVGAFLEDENAAGGAFASNAGSAYIFKRSGTVWSQEAKIVASDRAADDRFGWSVAISDAYVVVGAYQEDEDVAGGATATDAGSAYFFQRTVVLPVELTHFTGRSTEGGNLLTWATASEANNEGFEVERLTDAGQWSILGFVTGNNKASTYEFLDKNPFETSYYRLRQIDNGGKETVSKVISIQNKGSEGTLLVYPNPVSQTLNLDTEGGHFEIFNFLGQAVQQGVVSKSIDVSALPQGSYVLKIGTQHVKFVKE